MLAVILFAGQAPMRAWFHIVARQKSSELFMLNLLLVTLGLAALTELAGLSLALGAFLAGMLIAETEYRYQVEEDIKPFRDVLLGLFFVTVGMFLDLRGGRRALALRARAARRPGRRPSSCSSSILSRCFALRSATALRTGFYLAQAGEFALVMLALAAENRILAPPLTQAVLAAMVLSMLAAPLVIHFAEPVVRKLTANDWLARAAQITRIAATTMARQDHVIICGYGRSGQNLARLLEAEDIPFIALDSDPERVREATGEGSSVVYGDAGRKDALFAAGLSKARARRHHVRGHTVALKILHHVHQARPELPVVVRTLDDNELDRLLTAGAAEVVPEVLEGSLMLATHSLLLLGVPLNRVLKRIRAIREERYSLFRGFFHGASDAADAAENLQPRLHSVLLPGPRARVGRSLADVELAGLVEVTGVRRKGARSQRPEPGLGVRGRRHRRAARAARESRARGTEAAEALTRAIVAGWRGHDAQSCRARKCGGRSGPCSPRGAQPRGLLCIASAFHRDPGLS